MHLLQDFRVDFLARSGTNRSVLVTVKDGPYFAREAKILRQVPVTTGSLKRVKIPTLTIWVAV